MPLPRGRWSAVIDGATGEIEFSTVDSEGNVQGGLILPGQNPQVFRGMWNEAAQQVSFWTSALLGPQGPVAPEMSERLLATMRHFVGFVMRTPPQPPPGEDVTVTLAGYFDAAPEAGGHRRRERFGWTATTREAL